MTTALSRISGVPAGVAEYDEELAALLAEEDEQEETAFHFHATRLKFPSGGMTAGFPTSEDEMIPVPFEAIILVSQTTRAWWPREGNENNIGGAPACASNDGRVGFWRASDDMFAKATKYPIRHPALQMIDEGAAATMQPFQCASCPLGQYLEDKGTPCKELRRLLVQISGMASPIILTVPTGSISILDRYASAQKVKGRRYFAVWTKFELTKETSRGGIAYARLKLSFVRNCTPDEARAVIEVRRQFGELVRRMEITSDDYEVGGNGNGGVTIDADPIPF